MAGLERRINHRELVLFYEVNSALGRREREMLR